MGKIVKFCGTCEEGFAEKFGFCPNCGGQLSAFEMKPVSESEKTEALENHQIDESVPETKTFESIPPTESPAAAETVEFSAEPPQLADTREDVFEFEDDIFSDEPVSPEPVITETKAFSATAAGKAGNFKDQLPQTSFDPKPNFSNTQQKLDTNFHVTFVEEKNAKQRNGLLLGAMILMTTLAVGSWMFSLFNKTLALDSIPTDELFAYVPEIEPPQFDEPPLKKEKEDGGGGGGGGKQEKTDASKGRLVSQSENPVYAPNAKLPQLTNPDIKIIQETKGNIKRDITEEPAGLKNGLTGDLSNGRGNGGGIGNGNGTGIGNGRGGGEGNGNGNGSGNGLGNGNGNGTGNGGDRDQPEVAVKPVGPTEGVKILSKPRANYTDAARQNQVQGKVVLRVTFLANGTIGGISPVSGLPNGLTEQAIAAARGIKFEPAKKSGQPYAVTKTIEYTFTIY